MSRDRRARAFGVGSAGPIAATARRVLLTHIERVGADEPTGILAPELVIAWANAAADARHSVARDRERRNARRAYRRLRRVGWMLRARPGSATATDGRRSWPLAFRTDRGDRCGAGAGGPDQRWHRVRGADRGKGCREASGVAVAARSRCDTFCRRTTRRRPATCTRCRRWRRRSSGPRRGRPEDEKNGSSIRRGGAHARERRKRKRRDVTARKLAAREERRVARAARRRIARRA